MNQDHSEKAQAFLSELFELCWKHQVTISHEDGQGCFELETFKQDNIDWLNEAYDYTDIEPEPVKVEHCLLCRNYGVLPNGLTCPNHF